MVSKTNRRKLIIATVITFSSILFVSRIINAAEAKWMMVGNMHNFYQAHGCEPEEDYGSEQQWGLRWPAFF